MRAGWPESSETLLVGCLALMFRVSRLPRAGWLAREFRDAPRGLSGSGCGFRDCSVRAGWPESFETLLVGCLALVFRVHAFVAHRGFPPPGDELCVELCSDRWSTGLGPSALRLCGVLRAGALVPKSTDDWR